MAQGTTMEAAAAALALACKASEPDRVRRQALNAYRHNRFASGIAAILETSGVEGTKELATEALETYGNDREVIGKAVASEEDSDVKGELLALDGLLAATCEVVADLSAQTAGWKLGEDGTPAAEVPDLDDGLEPGDDPNIRASAAVHGPFAIFPPYRRRWQEKNFNMPVECGGCGVVVKEFRGLQLRRVLRLLTKTIEPWTSRARIIYRWVWVLEWVPVEVIKTITVKCCGEGGVKVDKQVVLDRELRNFWLCW